MTGIRTVPIQTDLPVPLLKQAEKLVEAGWYGSVDEILSDALRRFLDSHHTELMEQFIREDVEWGLHGAE